MGRARPPVRTVADGLLYLSRHISYPITLEGPLQAGVRVRARKKGPGSQAQARTDRVDPNDLRFVVVLPWPKNSTLHAKLLSNIREIEARGAITIVIAEQADDRVRPFADHLVEIASVTTPFQPLFSTVPLQLFAAKSPGPRLRRRQATQPGQVRHRRIRPTPRRRHRRLVARWRASLAPEFDVLTLDESSSRIGTTIDAVGLAVVAGERLLAVFMTLRRSRRDEGALRFLSASGFSHAVASFSPQFLRRHRHHSHHHRHTNIAEHHRAGRHRADPHLPGFSLQLR